MAHAEWFTPDECRALFDLLDSLSGGHPGSAFASDGSDSPADPTVRACAKLYQAAGRSELVPEHLRRALQQGV